MWTIHSQLGKSKYIVLWYFKHTNGDLAGSVSTFEEARKICKELNS